MWLSYIKVAFRSLIKQRLYAFINIAGLAIGVTTCVLILMYVRYENSYDEFHPKAEQIYRLGLQGKMGDNEFTMGLSSAIAGPTLKEDFPEVIDYVRIRNTGFPVLRYQDKVFSEEHWWQADSSIFDVFKLTMVLGDPRTALREPFSVVITEKMAQKYFGDEDPLGKVLNSDNRVDFKVTGVVQEMPPNSHWHFDFLGAMSTYGDSRSTIWVNNNFYTYLLLAEGADYRELRAKFPDLVLKYVGPQIERFLGVSFNEFEERGDAYNLLLDPMLDIHLYSHYDREIEVGGDGRTVTIFAYIAIFILLLACINYMNLSTARSMSRAREIGIRKTLGSKRSQIIVQFLAESIFVTFISFSLAIAIVQLIIPWFSNLIETPLSMSLADIPLIYLWVIPVGLLAGSYPAFLLSSFNPLKVLKGNRSVGKGGSWLRNSLVVFQFAVSITLLIGTVIVTNQLDYMQTKDLGLNPNDLLIIKKTDDIGRTIQGFKTSLRDDPGVLYASNSTAIPGNVDGLNSSVFGMLTDEGEQMRLLNSFWVDHDYANAYEIKMKEGRFFSRDWGTDTIAVILNEAAVKLFGIKDPVGKDLITFFGQGRTPFRVIGIVEDYQYQAPQVEIRPMCMFLLGDGTVRNRPNWGKFVAVRVDPDQLSGTLAHIEEIWKEHANEQALEYDHFDDYYAELFKSEKQSAAIISLFAMLAIFIATIGLLGLASYTAEKRTKEIGIRKVLGASIPSILVLLSLDTMKLMLVAVLIAVPVANYAMQRWLENFAYRIDVGIMIYAGSAGLALLIALMTVAWQSYTAAIANPIKSIRYE
ncbi:MAG: ABC transporter permease [Candidatus Marinimicrobia bacterium]|nr:ABC transporter permease [Candidatus Neomarinimicrobiota bacterium]